MQRKSADCSINLWPQKSNSKLNARLGKSFSWAPIKKLATKFIDEGNTQPLRQAVAILRQERSPSKLHDRRLCLPSASGGDRDYGMCTALVGTKRLIVSILLHFNPITRHHGSMILTLPAFEVVTFVFQFLVNSQDLGEGTQGSRRVIRL